MKHSLRLILLLTWFYLPFVQGTDLLGFCETDCDHDDDCADSYVCYQRDRGDKVPRCCDGSEYDNKDYCVPAGCAAYTDDDKLGPCDAGCHHDDDCPDYYTCLHRDAGDQVPRCCEGSGHEHDSKDYCVPVLGCDDLLGACETDCDFDDDCADDYVCYQRDAGDPVPKCCEGDYKDSKDYCIPETCRDDDHQDFFAFGHCKTDCDHDHDCDHGYVCYQRDYGDPVPRCCEGSRYDSEDYCVPEDCIEYDHDDHDKDDDRFFDGLMRCEADCDKDEDCNHGLICWQRSEGDRIPECCVGDTDVDPESSNKDVCAPVTCDDNGGDDNGDGDADADADGDGDGNGNGDGGEGRDGGGAGGGGGGGLCFSGETVVHLDGGIRKPMKDVRVGDRVLTGSGSYDPVYAFGHRQELEYAPFLQIHFTNGNNENEWLEMSKEHLVYVRHQTKPVRADSLQVGDALQSFNAQSAANTVTRIVPIIRQGLYAPLTRSGTLVVTESGIVASNYIAVQEVPDGYARFATIGKVPLHQSDLVHHWMSPIRILCSNFEGFGFCKANGMLPYVDWGIELVKYMEEQALVPQLLVFLSLGTGLLFGRVVEVLTRVDTQEYSWTTLLLCLCGFVAVYVNRGWKEREDKKAATNKNV